MQGSRGSARRIAVSVVSHGHGQLLFDLLDDLQSIMTEQDQLIVTVNRPEPVDRSRWPTVEWIDNTTPCGFGANHNKALAGRNAEWFAIVNPDVRTGSDVLSALAVAAAGDSCIGLVAPRVIGVHGITEDSARHLPTPFRILWRTMLRLTGRQPSAEEIPEPDWIAGIFYLVRREAFAKMRGFDERWFMYGEDVDFCARLALAGYRLVYCRDITVVHDARRDTYRSARHLRWHLTSLGKLWTSASFWRYWRQRRIAGSLGG